MDKKKATAKEKRKMPDDEMDDNDVDDQETTTSEDQLGEGREDAVDASVEWAQREMRARLNPAYNPYATTYVNPYTGATEQYRPRNEPGHVPLTASTSDIEALYRQ